MNKFLADALSSVNALIAFLIIVVPAFAAGVSGGSPLAFVVGGAAGLILAILICGTLALLLNIRDEIVLANAYFNDLIKKQK